MSDLKPIPDPHDPITRPYWDAAARDELRIQQCGACKQYHHPPVGICWHCQSTDLAFVPVSGRGTVYTYTIVRDQRIPAFDKHMPFVLGRVELEDAPGILLLTSILGLPVDQVRIGMPVEVEFEPIAEGVKIPQFRVTGSATGGA